MGEPKIMPSEWAGSCQGKQSAPNAGEAKRLMRRIISAGKAHGPMSVYKCRFCGQWHVGTMVRGT